MSVRYARPNVSELMFHVYRRSVHPELFAIHAEAIINRDDYQAVVRICETGHWVSFSCKNETICEIAASGAQLLPQRRHAFEKRLRGNQDEFIRFDSGIGYHVCWQLERLDSEVFLNMHDELRLDCRRATVSYQFPGSGRFAPKPLSLIRTDAWPGGLLVHTYHTFPGNNAIVKTQSLFEVV